MIGFTDAAACTQPVSRSYGTHTGARNSSRKAGVWISGPACIVRSRIATPVPNSIAKAFIRSASV